MTVGRRGARPGWLSISGGPPKELAADAIAVLVGIGHAAGVRVAVDTHGPALPGAVEAGPELVKINRYEAADLLDLSPSTDLQQLALAVRDRSGGLVVLTDGPGGALAVRRPTTSTGSPFPTCTASYPVGSGDSFLGGLLTELDRGASLVDGLRVAAAAGAANALVPGPGRFEQSSVEELTAQVRIDRV